MSDADARVVLAVVSVPDPAVGDLIADAVIEARLAACVKRSGPVRSTYRWRGSVERDDEWVLTCVTTIDRFDPLAALVVELHPYEVPEVIATPVLAGDMNYLAWVREESAAQR